METRRATTDDLDQIGSLLAAAGLPLLPQNIPYANLLVTLSDGRVIGAIALEVAARRGLLRSAVVQAAHQGRGVGASLLLSIIARAHELGLRELYVFTENADTFFAKSGFSVVARDTLPPEIRALQKSVEQCPDSAKVMCLRLATRLL